MVRCSVQQAFNLCVTLLKIRSMVQLSLPNLYKVLAAAVLVTLSVMTYTLFNVPVSLSPMSSTLPTPGIIRQLRGMDVGAAIHNKGQIKCRSIEIEAGRSTTRMDSKGGKLMDVESRSTTRMDSKIDKMDVEGRFTKNSRKFKRSRAEEITRALGNIDKCMYASNFTSPALLKQSRQNAQLFMNQYGSIISPNYLDGFMNYCWEADYSLSLTQYRLQGFIGKKHYTRRISTLLPGQLMAKYIMGHYHRRYCSSTVCLPNIYMLGFEKCGSSFFFCLTSKILNKDYQVLQAAKEAYFWTDFEYKIAKPDPISLATQFIPMYLKGSDRNIALEERKLMTFIDACPSTVLEWPKFTSTESNLTNCCLLPSALPELFPTSKYLVIMRNPVTMMYSSFWWSLWMDWNRNDIWTKQVQKDHSKGPEAFASRVDEKITLFLKCLNNHPTVKSQLPNCTIEGEKVNYAECIANRNHLLSECVAEITTKREFLEAVVHRGIYYVHVRKWLQTVPRERIFFTTMEKLVQDTQSVLKEVYSFLKGSELEITESQINELKGSCRENSNVVDYKKTGFHMPERTKTLLEKFFEPFNKLLSDLLDDEQFLWKT